MHRAIDQQPGVVPEEAPLDKTAEPAVFAQQATDCALDDNEPAVLLRLFAEQAAADLKIPVAQVNLLRLAYWLKTRRNGALLSKGVALR